MKISRFTRAFWETFETYKRELKNIFSDSAVLLLFLGGTFIYPVLYNWMYANEALHDTPIAVVDLSHSALSREFTRRVDATPDVRVAFQCGSMAEAENLFNSRKAHGIMLLPASFSDDIATGKQTFVSAYADMSSFLYYKAMTAAVSYASLEMGQEIQVSRLLAQGETMQKAMASANPIPSIHYPVYNQGGGYASFLIPAVLVLILHQTLIIGICVLAGIARERGTFNPQNYKPTTINVMKMITGKGVAYITIYFFNAFFILYLIPVWFKLPHVGNLLDIALFIVPFLTATIFFGLGISTFFKDRESPILTLIFLSVPLLFISGITWPTGNMPLFWKIVGGIFPSTHAVQGYVKMNSMGASLHDVFPEYLMLCIQTVLYGFCSFWLYKLRLKRLAQTAVDSTI